MKAGRELDILIAEKVFGLEADGGDVPHYSTRIADAWLLLDKLPSYTLGKDQHTAYPYWCDSAGTKIYTKSQPLGICYVTLNVFGIASESE